MNDEILFAFAYWIPKKLIINEIALIDILEIFVDEFGCRIKISDKEGFFIRKAQKLIQHKLESLDEVIEILGSIHIPCEIYLFSKENFGYNLNWIDCFYSFAINNNKYLGCVDIIS